MSGLRDRAWLGSTDFLSGFPSPADPFMWEAWNESEIEFQLGRGLEAEREYLNVVYNFIL